MWEVVIGLGTLLTAIFSGVIIPVAILLFKDRKNLSESLTRLHISSSLVEAKLDAIKEETHEMKDRIRRLEDRNIA